MGQALQSRPVVKPATNPSGDITEKVVAALDRLTRTARAHRQAMATQAGLTQLQAELVRVLADGVPPEPLTGLVAAEVGVSQPTVSDSLQALERKGLVERIEAFNNRHSKMATLTAAGAELASQLRLSDDVLRASVGRLPDGDQNEALRRHVELIAALFDTGVIQVARVCLTCRFYDSHHQAPYCTLLQTTLDPPDLQVNCPEHQNRSDDSHAAAAAPTGK